MDSENSVRLIEVSRLKPHPQNREIYGQEDISDLVVQIEAYGGIADPLKIKEDYTIISGHRRWQAAREIGIVEVPCQIVSYNSQEEELAALVMFNYHRAKTNEQKAREGMVLEVVLRAEGMARKLNALRQNQTVGDLGAHTEETDEGSKAPEIKGNPSEKGRTRDKVAAAVKISSGKSFERMKNVILFADKLREAGSEDDAKYLLTLMNSKVRTASNLVKAGFDSFSDEERRRIRSGEISVSQAVKAHMEGSAGTNNAKPNESIKKVLAALEATEQALTKVLPPVDSLDDDAISKLLEAVTRIQSAMSDIETKLKES